MADIYSVSSFNEQIKNMFEANFADSVAIRGEISNLKLSHGNAYFILRDQEANLKCTIWKDKYKKIIKELDNELVEGSEIIVMGSLKYFVKKGDYTFNVYKITLKGAGEISDEYAKLKEKYEANGYFKRKRQLPEYIKNIGLITAKEGAALQDILFVLKKGFIGNIYLKNTLVQGENCPQSIVEGIQYFNDFNGNKENKNNQIQVILLTRGGGSFQDLIGFSNEQVLKAIYESKICTISAVGHEVDNMLSDYMADMRQPTPSIAAEMLLQQQKNVHDKIMNANIFKDKIAHQIESLSLKLAFRRQTLCHPVHVLETKEKEFDNLHELNRKKVFQKLGNTHNLLDKLREKCTLLNPDNILKKGYVMLFDQNGKLITSKKYFNTEDPNHKFKFTIKFMDGDKTIEY